MRVGRGQRTHVASDREPVQKQVLDVARRLSREGTKTFRLEEVVARATRPERGDGPDFEPLHNRSTVASSVRNSRDVLRQLARHLYSSRVGEQLRGHGRRSGRTRCRRESYSAPVPRGGRRFRQARDIEPHRDEHHLLVGPASQADLDLRGDAATASQVDSLGRRSQRSTAASGQPCRRGGRGSRPSPA